MTQRVSKNDLCDASVGQLVIIDIQQRLAGAMAEEPRLRVIRNAGILIQAAALLDIPLLVTEQYPKGLGATEEGVAWHFPKNLSVMEKTCFACSGSDAFRDTLNANERHQVILTGMETHVCVLQTAMELNRSGYTVFVVEDGVCARRELHHHNALGRMRDAGVIVTNTESVLFEWLRDAGHKHFKQVSALIK